MRIVVIALLAAFVLAGCGAEDESDSGDASPATEITTATEDGGGGNGNGGNGDDDDSGDDTESGGEDENGDADDDGGDEEPSTSPAVVVGPLFADPRRVDFGAVEVGQMASASLTIANFRDVARVIVRLEVIGDEVSDFTIAGGDCAVGRELQPEASCSVELTFTPSAEGARRAVLDLGVDPPSGRQVLLLGMGGIGVVQPDGPTLSVEPEVESE